MRTRRGVLARQREEPAAAAHLRHRLGDQGRRSRPTCDRLAEAERRDHRKLGAELDLFCFPDEIGSGPGGVPPQGRRDQAGDGGLRPPAAHRGGLRVRRHPAHHQGRAVPHLRAPAVLRRHDVPADGARGRGLLPQGDELPDAQPDLPVARALLPRAAAAAVRVRHGLPLREVRRRPRPDPGARHDPGRLALLRHRASRRRARSSTCSTSCSACSRDFGLDDFYLELSTRDDAKPTSSSARDEEWAAATEVLRGRSRRSPASSWCPTRAAPRSTARRSRCRPATRSAAPGRCRRSSTTSTSPSGFGLEYQAADGTRAAAGDDPLGEVRLDRAVLRRAHRALRRRVPGLAGAGAGASASRSPSEHGDYLHDVAAQLRGAGHPGRGRRLRRPDAEEDPQRAASRRCRSC